MSHYFTPESISSLWLNIICKLCKLLNPLLAEIKLDAKIFQSYKNSIVKSSLPSKFCPQSLS